MVATLVQSSIQGGATSIYSNHVLNQQAKEFNAMGDHQKLKHMAELAKNSKTRGLSPEQYRRLIKRTYTDRGVEVADVFIPYDRALEIVDSLEGTLEGEANPLVTSIVTQLESNKEAAQDVVVSAEQFVAYAPEITEDLDGLLVDAKMTENGITFGEIEQQRAFFAKVVDKIKADSDNQFSKDANVGEIYNKVVEALKSKGRLDSETSELSAQIIPAMLSTLEEMSGIDAQEIFRMLPLDVLGMNENIPNDDDGDGGAGGQVELSPPSGEQVNPEVEGGRTQYKPASESDKAAAIEYLESEDGRRLSKKLENQFYPDFMNV